jgi:formylglycine-generating enzyme required for sulfatase activity
MREKPGILLLFILASISLSAQIRINGHEVVLVQGGYFERGGLIDTLGNRTYKHENTFPVHRVYVSDFYIGKYEVTNSQYCDFLNKKKLLLDRVKEKINIEARECNIKQKDGRYIVMKGFEDHPVSYVSWEAADEYCKFMGGRLPTEAEWQYAAVGGQRSKGYDYKNTKVILEFAVALDNFGTIQPVGSLKPNELGIYDMLGNVSEYCSDWYDENYYKYCPKKNPRGPAQSMKTENNVKLRATRGGAFNHHSMLSQPDLRYGTLLSDKRAGSFNDGFRICFDSKSQEKKPTP